MVIIEMLLTFQSFASRCNMSGSSGSSTSSGSSSSTLLTLACAWIRSSSENVRLFRFYRTSISTAYINRSQSKTYSAGIGEEVWANGLNFAIVGVAQLADGLEVLLASPALRQDRQR
jgi:hypothetical protein